jgi:hypothetical protein
MREKQSGSAADQLLHDINHSTTIWEHHHYITIRRLWRADER